MKKVFLTGLTLFSVSSNAMADDDYNLFNPVPDDKLRPFTTERPSKTDSVFTIDSGHLVVETSVDSYTHDNNYEADLHSNSFLNTTNIRLGLTQSTDLQLIINPYTDLDTHDNVDDSKSKQQGFGDTYLRLKYNIIGNNNEAFGAAIIPFVKFPTSDDQLGNSDFEGGVAVPLNYNLPDNWTIGGEFIYSALKNQDSDGYYGGYADSIILGKTIGDWSGYSELYAFLPNTGNRAWQNSADLGVIYSVSDNFHVDTGVNFGISEAAPDVNYFVGLAFRF